MLKLFMIFGEDESRISPEVFDRCKIPFPFSCCGAEESGNDEIVAHSFCLLILE